jgi:sortase A
MSLYSYKKEQFQAARRAAVIMSYSALTAGMCLLFWAFYPVISFELYSRLFMNSSISMPVPASKLASSIELAHSVLGASITSTNNVRDFTQASLWFPTSTITDSISTKRQTVKEYSLTIPKLNITDARVQVGGEDLTRGLVHFMPISMPGDNGNVVIFGHSTLPQLYNVKDYKTIFTYLPSLNKGDRLIAKVNGVSYEYEINEMYVVKPDQVSVLNQDYNQSTLTLITCVPPGTFWNRLVVKAKLTKLPTSL